LTALPDPARCLLPDASGIGIGRLVFLVGEPIRGEDAEEEEEELGIL
jgi:hypothetical protein